MTLHSVFRVDRRLGHSWHACRMDSGSGYPGHELHCRPDSQLHTTGSNAIIAADVN
ncbi:unnamed protein product [Mycena citricolor]|uniref:Uncharacterized protein n=1 Tax=Mycena citricolor TaxID=2018698 RepID=A0AAD2H886_9AGAR|nr:unnamed protein product [Mycena citricolor]